MSVCDLRKAALGLVVGLLFGCGSTGIRSYSGDGVFAVKGGDPGHYRLRYLDGQVSANDSCAIKLGNRLNPKVSPLYVNGEPVGSC
ncbi:MAG: hypothetical protein ACI8QC_001173 [Planctomycetota bacterium]|jgi:hypothetical protein